jgi:hypothetical protein
MKNYIVTIGNHSFKVEAIDLKSAKNIAQFNKRMQKLKGQSIVRLIS